jgi:hypothetical protein
LKNNLWDFIWQVDVKYKAQIKKLKYKAFCAFHPAILLTLSEQHFDIHRKHYDAVWG